jgi:hypothetical protein
MTQLISFPETKSTIDAIRKAIGRPVTFYQEYLVPCTGCSIDSVTGLSTNPFHVPCAGRGYIITYSGTVISGYVSWSPSDNLNWQTGGQFFTGDCGLQISSDPPNPTIVTNAKYLVVDGKKMSVKNKIMRGTPQINRILLDLQEQEP